MTDFPRRDRRDQPAGARFSRLTYGHALEAMRREMEARFEGWSPGEDEFGDGLIDATAAVCDQLGFYTEIWSDEGALRTALDSNSIRLHTELLPFDPHPGSAATTRVVFDLKADKAAHIEAGTVIRGQGPNGSVVFETEEAIDAAAELNRLEARTPVALRWDISHATGNLADGRLPTNAIPFASTPSLVTGERLVVVHGTTSREVRVKRVQEVADDLVLVRTDADVMTRNAVAADVEVFRAPASEYRALGATLQQSVTSGASPFPSAEKVQLQAGAKVDRGDVLRIVETGQPSAKALSVAESRVHTVELTIDLGTGSHTSTMTREVVELTLSDKHKIVGAGQDEYERARQVRFLALKRDDQLDLETSVVRPQAASTQLEIPDGIPETLRRGRTVLVEAADGTLATRVANIDRIDGKLEFTQSLESLGRVSALRANVAIVSHGESIGREVLGSGQAQKAGQSFVLSRAPLTFMAYATTALDVQPDVGDGLSAELTIEVDGVRWHRVEDLSLAGPLDRVYSLERTEEGKTRVKFGDGVHGARLSTGKQNVVAFYRVGLGADGLVDEGGLEKVPSLGAVVEAVTNPFEATGGEEPQGTESIRHEAPRAMRALDRLVTPEDAVVLAEQYPGVERAWASQVDRRVVRVVMLPTGGFAADSTFVEGLRRYLSARALPGVRLRIQSPELVQIEIHARVCRHSDYDQIDTEAAVAQALSHEGGFTDPVRRGIGQPVHRSDILAVIQSVAGVVSVESLGLRFAGDATAREWLPIGDDAIALWLDDPADGKSPLRTLEVTAHG
ncbi:MAG: putative baseplate assembly protein [Myxococcota bacterium]